MKFKTLMLLFSMVISSVSHSETLSKKSVLWSSIPFFISGDLGQYEVTMSQTRDQVRKAFWNELSSTLAVLSQSTDKPELLIAPLTKALMIFDQVHDEHKNKDSFLIDQSLEAQFKSNLDLLYRQYDIREHQRNLKLVGTKEALTQGQGFIGYGTFSSLGRGNFNLTFHMQSLRTGELKSFSKQGRLLEALHGLSLEVFNEFQKVQTPDWENPQSGLQWLPQPNNPEKTEFTIVEAKMYCKARGFRLPYARELMLAESGSQYKLGGISKLIWQKPYPVLDQRRDAEQFIYRPGFESATGGPIMAAVVGPKMVNFYCVKGTPSSDILKIEKLWSLRREHIDSKELVRAIDTLRADAGDFDAETIFWGPKLEMLTIMSSPEEALRTLKNAGIRL